jgi:hypothetical protein
MTEAKPLSAKTAIAKMKEAKPLSINRFLSIKNAFSLFLKY